MQPSQELLATLDGPLQHATAAGSGGIGCVSRSFAPKLSIPEDPVCGSGHCHIVPYWVQVLGKKDLVAYQASRRGGTLQCHMQGEKVILGGQAAMFSEGEIRF